MGKSNVSKKVNAEVLRKFVKERAKWKMYAIMSAVLFVVCCFACGRDLVAYGWLAVLALIVYAVCMVMFRIKSQCPHCGKAIMQDFDKQGGLAFLLGHFTEYHSKHKVCAGTCRDFVSRILILQFLFQKKHYRFKAFSFFGRKGYCAFSLIYKIFKAFVSRNI
jgi:hypothetical protein